MRHERCMRKFARPQHDLQELVPLKVPRFVALKVPAEQPPRAPGFPDRLMAGRAGRLVSAGWCQHTNTAVPASLGRPASSVQGNES